MTASQSHQGIRHFCLSASLFLASGCRYYQGQKYGLCSSSNDLYIPGSRNKEKMKQTFLTLLKGPSRRSLSNTFFFFLQTIGWSVVILLYLTARYATKYRFCMFVFVLILHIAFPSIIRVLFLWKRECWVAANSFYHIPSMITKITAVHISNHLFAHIPF